jgi:hypothetical protein
MLAEKDKAIDKLTKFVQRARKTDERKQKQIDDLQSELHAAFGRFSGSGFSQPVETIAKLEAEVHELEARLENSEASLDMASKNERLTKMLDRSNGLYATLLAQHQELLAKTSGKPIVTLSRVSADVFTQSPPAKARGSKEQKALNEAYLKRAIAQFFLQDPSKRGGMVRMIMELAGCPEDQIGAAEQQWQKSDTQGQKLYGFLGF